MRKPESNTEADKRVYREAKPYRSAKPNRAAERMARNNDLFARFHHPKHGKLQCEDRREQTPDIGAQRLARRA